MTDTRHTRLLILGAGPAGYTAAIYAARAGLEPVVLAGLQPGGQLTITTDVENYPGFAATIQGPWLMEEMRRQAEHHGATVIEDLAVEVDLRSRPFWIRADQGVLWRAEALIIATGAQAKWLGIPGEERLRGQGVSACATCDGFFFRNRHVAVIGGGNTAVEEALYLAQLASRVTLIHRRDSLRAEKVMQRRLFAHPKIEVVWNTVVDEVLGDPSGVTGLQLRDVADQSGRVLPVDGVFVAIGHSPNTALFRDQIELDDEGYIVTAPGTTRTNVAGVFAAGDVQDKVWRQAVTAAGTGCMAALEADRLLASVAAEAVMAAQ